MKTEPNRITILGCPGSGKTFLSRLLSEKLHLPVIHLDDLYWCNGWERSPDAVFYNKVMEVLKGERWIIDGNFHKYALIERLERSECVIFLDIAVFMSFYSALYRIVQIFLGNKAYLPGKIAENFKKNKKNRFYFDLRFLKLILNFNKEIKPGLIDVIREYQDIKRIIIVKNRKSIKSLVKKDWSLQ